MSVKIVIPQFGESVTQVTIGAVLKPTGSVVAVDEEIIELETDKLNQTLHASSSGKVEWTVATGDVVTVGATIGTIDPSFATQELPKETPKPKEVTVFPTVRKTINETVAEMGKKPEAPIKTEAPPGRETRKKMTQLRQTIAKRLVQVKNETAMLTTFNEIDMSSVMDVRAREQEAFEKKYGVRLGFMSFFIKAAMAALQEFPEINGKIMGDEIVYHHFYDISVAVSTDKGLMVPVIRGVENLSYAEIEKALKDVATRARTGALRVEDLQGGTFTITNAGLFGSLLSTPLLNPPQSGILGMHNIVKRAVVIGDAVVIRPMMYVALSYDHRIVDGKQAVSFLMHMKKNLEEPARLLLDL